MNKILEDENMRSICKKRIRSKMQQQVQTVSCQSTSLSDFATEIWRFERVVQKLLIEELCMDSQRKYRGKYEWFSEKANDFFKKENISIFVYETGSKYDVGMPVSVLNIADFGPSDDLYISQVLEPVVMRDEKILRSGSVLVEERTYT